MTNKTVVSTHGQSVYAAVLETRNYIVGEANAASGLYRRTAAGWTHAGWKNLRCAGLTLSQRDSDTLFLASGNGVLRSRDGGGTWRVTTDWRVAEVLDVVLDPFAPSTVYAASAYGLWHSPDEGETWTALPAAAPHPNAMFTPTLALDTQRQGRVVIGTEDGLFDSADGGQTWQTIGPRVAVRALAQSAARPEVWLGGTDGHGLLLSTDGGATWSVRADGAIVYAVAVDPDNSDCLAAAGYETGLLYSTDGGATWHQRELDLPVQALHALAFDPQHAGRLWLGTVGEGVFWTDDFGRTCEDAGLPETTVYDLDFAPA